MTSYHLRVLAEHEFIVEDTERGNGRDRWWRAVHRATSFTFRIPDDPGDAQSVEEAERFVRMDADEMYQRMVAFIDTFAARRGELADLPWTLSYWPVRLTRAEARALAEQVNALVMPYRRQQGDPDPCSSRHSRRSSSPSGANWTQPNCRSVQEFHEVATSGSCGVTAPPTTSEGGT